MDKDVATFGGRLRLTAAILLFLLSILLVIPAPTYFLWQAEIAATEWSPYFAAAALALLLPGWRYGRFSIISSMIALLVFCLDVTPMLRAVDIGRTLPLELETAFGKTVPRSMPGAPALVKPITLRLLYEAPPAPNVAVNSLTYSIGRGGFLKLDLYKSTSFSSPRPVVVVLHGGSWRGGNREDLADLNFYLAARGYAVAAISYRFAPEFPNPAQSQDLNAAIAYLKSNAARLALDPTQFVLLGRSAGGHLALLSAYQNRDSAIRGVVGLYPPTDQYYGYQNPSRIIASRQILKDYIGGTPLTMPWEYIANSPLSYVNTQSPPTLLIHGTKDELVSVVQSRMLRDRLKARGRPHLLLEMPWATHGCDYVFTGPCGQLTTFAIERFLASVLR